MLGSCSATPPQKLNSCTKGTRVFPKNPNGDLELEQKKGLTPFAGLPGVVIPGDCVREGKKSSLTM